MQIKNASEVVYCNNGAIYKSPSQFDVARQYLPDSKADPIFPFSKFDGKRYFVTQDLKAYFGDYSDNNVTLQGYDLCPDVKLWCGLGAQTKTEKQNFDLYFDVDSTQQLQQIADYYKLRYPVSDGVSSVINTEPETICWKNAGGKPIILGAVKFIDGVATILKLYTYPKAKDGWSVWMYGASFFDHGKCFEKGAIYFKETGGTNVHGAEMRGRDSFRKAEFIRSERYDGINTLYSFTDNGDPGLFWKGTESDAQGNKIRIKHYESSRLVHLAIAKMKRGPDLLDRDLCPLVQYWLGRSWYDNVDSEELLFAIPGGSKILSEIAKYYNLPIPCNNEQAAILDTHPELYRARHYDLLGNGVGKYVNVVVGSIIFAQGKPVNFLLYTFMRPWEFKEAIPIPDFQ